MSDADYREALAAVGLAFFGGLAATGAISAAQYKGPQPNPDGMAGPSDNGMQQRRRPMAPPSWTSQTRPPVPNPPERPDNATGQQPRATAMGTQVRITGPSAAPPPNPTLQAVNELAQRVGAGNPQAQAAIQQAMSHGQQNIYGPQIPAAADKWVLERLQTGSPTFPGGR